MPIFPMGRSRLDVCPADVGRRVSVRYRSGLRPEAEVVGVLFRWTGDQKTGILRIRLRSGTEVGIRQRNIVAMRIIPPESSALAMLRLAEAGWPPMETLDLDTWVLRASQGASARANSVRVGGLPDDLDKQLAQTVDWYQERDLPPLLQIPEPLVLQGYLVDRGWQRKHSSRLMTCSATLLRETAIAGAYRADLDIEVRTEFDDEWLEFLPRENPTNRPEYERALGTAQPQAFVYCRNTDGVLLGIGHAVRLDDWCGYTTLAVSPDARRGGVATAVTNTLAEWAIDNGARNWFLQFYESNAAALNFYEGLGFTTHHRYSYWLPEGFELVTDSDV
jgi:ribosomal protein S18 acetylase RimI-like enzyme